MKHPNRIPLFYLVTALYWFSLYTYVPNLSSYAGRLGASYKLVGLIIGSYGFAQMLLRVPLGITSDKLNRRKLFVIAGVLLGLVSSLGMWLTATAGSLLFFRALSGAAAASWVAFTVLFSSYFESNEAPRAIGYLTSATTLGQVAAVFAGGIAAQSFGEKAPFLLAAIGGAVGLLFCPAIIEKTPANRKPMKFSHLVSIAADKRLLLFASLGVLVQFITFATVYGFTPVAAEKLGATPFQLGLLTTVSSIPGIIAAALSGSFFARYLGEKNTLVYGFLVSAAATFAIPYMNNLPLLFVTQFIGGFGLNAVFPLLMGLSIKNIDDSKRATAMGFFQAIYGIGMFMGPVIVGFLSDTVGLGIGFLATGMTGILGAFISIAWVDRMLRVES